jgi:hypothetical protein|tara:strand:- start:1873 stop:2226 length:354 start_codon:yes stop_codon:yes gene_type:complete
MDLKQRYTLVNDYDVEKVFIKNLKKFDFVVGLQIAKLLEQNLYNIPINNESTQVYGGVVHYPENEPTFFVVELLKEDNGIIVLTNITQTHVDEYLDLINLGLNLVNPHRIGSDPILN